VSSGWYNHVNVPTWNYITVHVSGPLKIMDDKELYASLKHLVDKYESGASKPVTMEGLPDDLIDKYLKGIVGFRMEIEKIEGKWKLSQNRNEEDFKNIIAELEKLNDVNANEVAAAMKSHNPFRT
jgi:transcriptional regulator